MSSQFWDDRYRADEYAYGREPNTFLRSEAGRIAKGKVLCLAEGEGRNAAVHEGAFRHGVSATVQVVAVRGASGP